MEAATSDPALTQSKESPMPQADQTNTTAHAESTLRDVHEELADLESPLHEIRGLANAVWLMADAASFDKPIVESFQIVADKMTDTINSVIETREKIWRMSAETGGTNAQS
jgi:hypothetical protein